MSNAGDGPEIDLASRMQAIAEEDAQPAWTALRYRKRPVEIEAVQFGLAEYADDPWHAWRTFADDAPQWLLDAATEGTLKPAFASEDELYFCKDRIFRATYEPVA